MDEPNTPDAATSTQAETRKMTPTQMQGLMAAAVDGVKRELRGWSPPGVAELQQMLPQYEITAFLARGGMGAVYRGVQRSLARAVAIKILPPGLMDDGTANYAERFKQEARAMAKFKHPGIVTVYEAGETADGLLYLVMEFIEGTDVAQLVAANGKLTPEQAVRITTGVCEALAYAHSRGVVHRDIKPSNIMIETDGTVKVADFGLAKLAAQEGDGLTQSNVAMGTPDFLAPEAFVPGIQVDLRADIYAVGVMLYQMLTGQVPRGRFESPSIVVPKMDKSFDAIVDKAMQTDREKRYSTALEMKTEVERVGDGNAGTSACSSSKGSVAAKHPDAGSSARTPFLIAAGVVAIGAGAFFMLKKVHDGRAAGPPSAAASPTTAVLGPSALAKPGSFFPLSAPRRTREAGQVVMWRLDGQPVDPNDPEAKLPPGLDDVVMLSSGNGLGNSLDPAKKARHLLALRGDGTVSAWGGNSAGQSTVPAGLRDVVSIAASGELSAALDAQGRLMAWGRQEYLKALPSLTEKVVHIDGRKWHMAALTESGKIHHFGAVGKGDSVMLPHNETPVALNGRAVQLAVAGDWLAALRDDGRLFAWGVMSYKDSNGSDIIPQTEWDWSGDAATKRVPFELGKVPRLFTHNYHTDIYVEGFERFPVRLASSLSDWTIKSSRYLEARKMDLSGLEGLVFDDPAKAFKLKGRWYFDEAGTTTDKTEVNMLYCEQQAQGCRQLVFTSRHVFGIKPVERAAKPVISGTAPVSSSPRPPLPPPPTVSIPGLPDLPPLTIPLGAPGLVKEFDLKGGFVHGIKVLPDSRRILVMRSDESLQLYDLEKQAAVWTMPTKGKQFHATDVSQDGSRFVTYGLESPPGAIPNAPASKEARITLRRMAEGSIIQEWTVPTSITGPNNDYAALSPSGKRIAVRVKTTGGGKYDTTFIGLEEGNAQPVAEWSAPGHNGHTTLALDEDRFLSTGNGAPVTFRFSSPGTVKKTLGDMASLGSALSPDRRWLLAYDTDADAVAVWDIQAGKRLPFFERSLTKTAGMAFARNDLALIIRDSRNPVERQITVWDRASGDELASFTAPKTGQAFTRLAVAANGRFCLASVNWEPKPAGEDANILHLQIWRLPQPGAKAKVVISSQPVVTVPGLPDLPPMVVPSGEPGLVKRLATGGRFLGDFRLLPDSRRILLFQAGQTRLLDLERESPVWSISSASGQTPAAVALSGDGSRFVACERQSTDVKGTSYIVFLRRISDGSVIRQWPVEIQVNAIGSAVTLNPAGNGVLVRLANPNGKGTNAELVAFDADKPEPVAKWSLPDQGNTNAFSLDEDQFILAGSNGLGVLDVHKPGAAYDQLINKSFSQTAMTTDKRWIVCGLNGKFQTWDVQQKKFGPPFEPGLEADQLKTAGSDLFVTTGDRKETPAAKHLDLWDRTQGKRVASFQPPPGLTFLGGLDGAATGAFGVVRLKALPGGPPDDNVIEIYRLPTSGQVHASAVAASGAAAPKPPSGLAPASAPGDTTSVPGGRALPSAAKSARSWVKVNFVGMSINNSGKISRSITTEELKANGGLKLMNNDLWLSGAVAGIGQVQNGAIRVRFKRTKEFGEKGIAFDIGMRGAKIFVDPVKSEAVVFFNGSKTPASRVLPNLPTGLAPPIGQEMELEIGCVGRLLVMKRDGMLIGTRELPVLDPAGDFRLQGSEVIITSAELLNLDGLPEPQAQKMLGVE